ncbi:hypothetical protein D3C75_685850 [compost metagenome]
MAGLPGNVPQAHRVSLGPVPQPGHAGDALGHLALRCTSSAQAAKVTFHIGGEHRNPRVTERFRQMLQGDGLASTRCTRYQAMAVGQPHGLPNRLAIRASAYNDGRNFRHLFNPLLKLYRNSADTCG